MPHPTALYGRLPSAESGAGKLPGACPEWDYVPLGFHALRHHGVVPIRTVRKHVLRGHTDRGVWTGHYELAHVQTVYPHPVDHPFRGGYQGPYGACIRARKLVPPYQFRSTNMPRRVNGHSMSIWLFCLSGESPKTPVPHNIYIPPCRTFGGGILLVSPDINQGTYPPHHVKVVCHRGGIPAPICAFSTRATHGEKPWLVGAHPDICRHRPGIPSVTIPNSTAMSPLRWWGRARRPPVPSGGKRQHLPARGNPNSSTHRGHDVCGYNLI